MLHKSWIKISLVVICFLIVMGLGGLMLYYGNLPKNLSQHETIVLGQNRIVPGSQAALRVLVRDYKNGMPLENAQVVVSFRNGNKKTTVYEGVSDKNGTADVSFRVPDFIPENPTLVIETKSKLGQDTVERSVSLKRDYRILLTTDKPIYQPGQVIHIRALALDTYDLYPAKDQTVEVVIADGKGNKVFRQSFTTSEFGILSTDFQLANEVNTGNYKISAWMGEVSSEKTVRVENYVLPKFDIKMNTDRTFYQPGQMVKGEINAVYFFGKPVAGGQVSIEGFTFDVERMVTFTLEGTTDENGAFSFEFPLPDYIAGSDLESGIGRYYLQATVVDQANHAEIENLSLPVSASVLVIDAVPESGQFRPGVENILYLLTSYPDGSPAKADLKLNLMQNGEVIEASTNEYGLAEITLNPANPYQEINIEARDEMGNLSSRYFYFSGEWSEEYVLLRPEKPFYRVGDDMRLSLFTSQPKGMVYLDIIRGGQTISTRSVTMENGKAEVIVDLTPDMVGTLELHAYKILSSGMITRDTRLVVVDDADALNLLFQLDKEVYLPGSTAQAAIQVTGQDRQGVQSALGIAVVDESVFALAEQDPGFARLYFMLEQEILQPKYDLHGYSIMNLSTGIPEGDPYLINAVETTAQASLSQIAMNKIAQGGSSAFSMQINSHQENEQRVRTIQQSFFNKFSKILAVPFYLLPLGMVIYSIYALAKEKQVWRALGLAIGIGIGLALFFYLLGYFAVNENAEWLMILIGLIMIAAFIGLIVYVLWKKPPYTGWLVGGYILLLVFSFFLVFSLKQTSLDISDVWIIIGVVGLLLVPFAFLLRAAGLWLKKQWGGGWLVLLGGSLPAFVLILLFAFSLSGYAMGVSRAPMMVEDVAVMKEVEMAQMAPVPTMVAEGEVLKSEESGATPTAGEPPRLRQFFPETMLWLPEAVTDPSGFLKLEMPVADSITTWRITALASSQDGRLGSTTLPLLVFQDFFIDLDLPLSLTVGDEVAVPVGVFNYLNEEQTVRLELEQAGWLDLLDSAEKEMTIPANDIDVVYFRIRAKEFGRHPFKVTAWGSKMSDAIQKEVKVFPNGKEIRFTQSDRLSPGEEVRYQAVIPADAIAGTQKLLVKVYPGMMSQVVEGLDSILRMPYGCFEQTSSTTYPNVLVLDYLQTTNQAAPEVQMKAEEYINLGYQRLTTFEVASSGGFSLFGNEPADRMLTAYGLQEFSDMSRVHPVDQDLINRAARWLLSQQEADGSWKNDQGLVHENTWSNLADDRLPVTAYIVWSLIEAGFYDDPGTQRGLSYVQEFQQKAEDPYVIALTANALVAADLRKGGISPVTEQVLDRLASLAQQNGTVAFWQSRIATFMGGQGNTGSIETTALAALAFIKADSRPDLANGGLTYLIQQKDSFGTWYSTQATILTLKALIQSVRSGAEKIQAEVTITLNGGQAKTVQVSPENFDVVQLISFDDVNLGSPNTVVITAQGEGNLMYQVTGSYYLPWEKLSAYPELIQTEEPVTIDVQYDRAELAVNDTVTVNVTVTLNEPGAFAEAGLIDLGLPPGFSVETQDLSALVARFRDVPQDYDFPTIERYELTGRQILIYVRNLSQGKPLEFSYRLRAKYPLRVQAPSSNAYDYYNPDVSGEVPPQFLTVQAENGL